MRRLLTIAGALAAGGATLLVACSSDDSSRPSSLLDASPADASSPPSTDGAADADALATITPRPDLCENLTLGGATVDEITYPTDAIPPIGGEVMPGTYDLTEANQYDGTADAGDVVPTPSGRTVTSTIVVTAFELRLLTAVDANGATDAGDGGTGVPAAQAFLYRTVDTSILGTLVCPTTALPAPMGYSASGNGLALYPDATHRWLYARR